MYFYSRNNFINDLFSVVYCYIVYFLSVLARNSKFTFFAFTSHKVFKSRGTSFPLNYTASGNMVVFSFVMTVEK